MTEEHNQQQQMMINHKYKIWKKTSPSYYQLALIHSLEWPSTTFQWLPQYDYDSEDNQLHYAIICSNSSQIDQSELLKIRIKIPLQSKEQAYIKDTNQKIQIIQRKVLGAQINRARYCYEKSSLVATTHSNGQILLTQKGQVVHKLVGHTSQGYGLSWNSVNKNILISGHTDKRICIYDVTKNRQQTNKIIPSYQILHHSTPVQDVAWHKMHPNIFASCSDDRLIMVWDMRFKNSGTNNIQGKPMFQIIAHTNQVYSLDFSPFNQFLFLSGSADQTVSVWDMRNLTHSFETFRSENSVIKVQWSPFTSTIFGTCGYDHSVNLWDLGLEKRQDSQKNLFVHGGHRSKVLDFDWNQNKRTLIGSTQQNNCLHVWEMARSLYFEELNK